jgi:hypothetical protein
MWQIIIISFLSILSITFIILYLICRNKLLKEVEINNELYDNYNKLLKNTS